MAMEPPKNPHRPSNVQGLPNIADVKHHYSKDEVVAVLEYAYHLIESERKMNELAWDCFTIAQKRYQSAEQKLKG